MIHRQGTKNNKGTHGFIGLSDRAELMLSILCPESDQIHEKSKVFALHYQLALKLTIHLHAGRPNNRTQHGGKTLSKSKVLGLMNVNCTSVRIVDISLCSGKSGNILHFRELHVMKLPTYILNCLFSYLDYYNCNSLFSGGFWNKSKVPARTGVSFTESLESRDPTRSRCWRSDSVCWPTLWWLHGVWDVQCTSEYFLSFPCEPLHLLHKTQMFPTVCSLSDSLGIPRSRRGNLSWIFKPFIHFGYSCDVNLHLNFIWTPSRLWRCHVDM